MSKITSPFKARIKELRKQIETEAKEFFKTESKALFSQFDELKSFSWTQYTPYFNDGQECTFSSNHNYPEINDRGEDDDGEEKETPAVSEKCDKAIEDFLGNFDDEDMEVMFGDHVKVTVTRKGVSTDEYSHD